MVLYYLIGFAVNNVINFGLPIDREILYPGGKEIMENEYHGSR